MTRQGNLLIISGPSGAGKSTVIRRVMAKRPNIYFSVSCTTRKPREGEQEGVNYYYISNREFEQMVQQDALLEHAGYVDHYYGTPKEPISRHLDMGWDVILDIEVQGAAIVRGKMPGAVTCFLIPPSFEELERRLRNRGSEEESVIQGRLERARKEYEQIKHYDYLVVNDDAEVAAEQICAILEAAGCRTENMIKTIEGEN